MDVTDLRIAFVEAHTHTPLAFPASNRTLMFSNPGRS